MVEIYNQPINQASVVSFIYTSNINIKKQEERSKKKKTSVSPPLLFLLLSSIHFSSFVSMISSSAPLLLAFICIFLNNQGLRLGKLRSVGGSGMGIFFIFSAWKKERDGLEFR